VLDVGCGYGKLGADIKEGVNSDVIVEGLDVRAQEGQERLSKMHYGGVDKLSPLMLGDKTNKVALVTSAALMYHLQDPWGAVLRMSSVLRKDGLLLISTMPRVVNRGVPRPLDQHAYGDERGYLLNQAKIGGGPQYYTYKNVFDTEGQVVGPGEVVDIINADNPFFPLEYGVDSSQTRGSMLHGGQISGWRASEKGLDLSCLFYCKQMASPYEDMEKGEIGYILAKNKKEKAMLRQMGYLDVQTRFYQGNLRRLEKHASQPEVQI